MRRRWQVSPHLLGQDTSTNWQFPFPVSVCESSAPNSPVQLQPRCFIEQLTFSSKTFLFCFLSRRVVKLSSLQKGHGFLSVVIRLMQLWQKCCPQQLVRVGSRVTSRQRGHSNSFSLAGGSRNSWSYPPVFGEAIIKMWVFLLTSVGRLRKHTNEFVTQISCGI